MPMGIPGNLKENSPPTSRDDINLKNLNVHIIYDNAMKAPLNIYMSDCFGW